MKTKNFLLLGAAVAMAVVMGVSMVGCNLFSKADDKDDAKDDASSSSQLLSSSLIGTWRWEETKYYTGYSGSKPSGNYKVTYTITVISNTEFIQQVTNEFYGSTSTSLYTYAYNEALGTITTIKKSSGYGYNYTTVTNFQIIWVGADQFYLKFHDNYYNQDVIYGPYVRVQNGGGSSSGQQGQSSTVDVSSFAGTWKCAESNGDETTLVINSSGQCVWSTYSSYYNQTGTEYCTFYYNSSTSVVSVYFQSNNTIYDYTVIWYGTTMFCLKYTDTDGDVDIYGPYVLQQ